MKLLDVFEKERKKRLWDLTPKQRKIEEARRKEEGYYSSEIKIVAQLSHRDYNLIKNGNAYIQVPSGVEMTNKGGSRSLEFYCENEEVAEELINGLDLSGISWSEESGSQEIGMSHINQIIEHGL